MYIYMYIQTHIYMYIYIIYYIYYIIIYIICMYVSWKKNVGSRHKYSAQIPINQDGSNIYVLSQY